MLNRIRDQIGTAGLIVAIVALVAALGGAAVAANNSGGGENANATVSAKAKKGPRGPKGPKGDTGPAGPVGPAGPQGAKGDAGANGQNGAKGDSGTNGTNGTNGTSVTSTPEDPGANCVAGGTKFVAGASTTYACNGEEGSEGSPWTAGGTLPSGKALTGSWAVSGQPSGGLAYTQISFPIQLSAALGQSNVHNSEQANFTDFDGPGGSDIGCKGTTGAPTAPAGHLCVYANLMVGGVFLSSGLFGIIPPEGSIGAGGAGVSGAILAFGVSAAPMSGFGSWAVTAP